MCAKKALIIFRYTQLCYIVNTAEEQVTVRWCFNGQVSFVNKYVCPQFLLTSFPSQHLSSVLLWKELRSGEEERGKESRRRSVRHETYPLYIMKIPSGTERLTDIFLKQKLFWWLIGWKLLVNTLWGAIFFTSSTLYLICISSNCHWYR